MKIAVTGATGFIGKYVLKELSKYSVEVIALVRNTANISLENFDAKIFQLDLYNPPDGLFDLLGCPDVLIHLAWGGLPNYSSLHHFEEELPKQYQFLKGLIQSGLSNLVVSGTCFEYGMQLGCLKETFPTVPNTSYGYAKNGLRCQLEYLKYQHPFRLVWTRLFYMYGNGQHKNTIFSQLKHSVQNQSEVFNMSGGEQLRDYLHVSDIAKILVKLALKKKYKDVGIVNICSGKPISIRTLVEHWINSNGWKIALNLGYYPYPEYESMAFWGDREKLDSFLETL